MVMDPVAAIVGREMYVDLSRIPLSVAELAGCRYDVPAVVPAVVPGCMVRHFNNMEVVNTCPDALLAEKVDEIIVESVEDSTSEEELGLFGAARDDVRTIESMTVGSLQPNVNSQDNVEANAPAPQTSSLASAPWFQLCPGVHGRQEKGSVLGWIWLLGIVCIS